MRQSITALSAVVVGLLFTIPVSATNQRSFVASNGADANPCTRDLPCRNFAAAVLQTNANGEVIAIDSAGYGPVTITKSVAIIAPPGVHAGISVFTGDGVTVNAGVTDVVVLRNLYINSQGGLNGITLASAAVLHIEGCVVSGFSQWDINLVPSSSAAVAVNDTVVRQGGAGIFADSANPLTVSVDHCRIELNIDGVLADSGTIFIRNTHAYANSGNSFFSESNTSPTTFVIENSSVAGIGGSSQGIRLTDTIAAVHNTIISGMHYGIVAGMGAVASVETCVISKNAIDGISVAGGADVSVSNSTIADNNAGGITVTGASVARVSHCTITRNSVGLNNLGGTLLSAGDNTVDGNSSESSGTIGLATKM